MVKYKCPRCKAVLESPPSMAGTYDECPICHTKVLVPGAPAPKGNAQKKATGVNPETKIVIGGIGAIAVVAVGIFCIWFFAIRDTWERDHSSQIMALHDQASDFKAANDLPGASAKLHKVLALVGKRNLRGNDLRSTMDDIRKSSQEIDRVLVLRELPKHLQDAADLLAADKIEGSRAGYHAVLDAVTSQGAYGPDALRAADLARDGLSRVDARQAAIVAERSRQEAESALARQREEEATRNAKITATISGGAWIVKGGGSSDLLRGMKVYLIKDECTGKSVRQCYQQAADEAKSSAEFWRKAAKENREKPDEYGIYKKSADDYDADANALDEYATAVIADAKKIPYRMGVRDAYRLVRHVANSEPKYSIAGPLGARFGDVIKEVSQKTVQVNIDGKFSFDAVPGGKHYLYAFWSTEFSSIEWLIPLDVKESVAISQDLFNDTAEIIWNKHQ